MEGHSLISPDIIARYAEDAALEIDGVRGLVTPERGKWRHRGARVTDVDGAVTVELHLELVWGASAPTVGGAAQTRVAEYLGRMADLASPKVDVVIDAIGPPPEGT